MQLTQCSYPLRIVCGLIRIDVDVVNSAGEIMITKRDRILQTNQLHRGEVERNLHDPEGVVGGDPPPVGTTIGYGGGI